jgi:hypothetical protein
VKAFRNAVELDEYLASLTDEDRAQLNPNIGMVDQVRKAQAEGISDRESVLGNKARWVPHLGLPEWVRLGMYDVLIRWSEGRALTCSHQPSIDRPQPVYAAAWKPGVVVCGQCQPMLRVIGLADRTCDGCGHECMGMPDDGILPVSAFTGALAYQVGVCVSCEDEMRRVEAEVQGVGPQE